MNTEAVERCVGDVVRIAKELNSDESRYFQAVRDTHIHQLSLSLSLSSSLSLSVYLKTHTHSLSLSTILSSLLFPTHTHSHCTHIHTHTQSRSFPVDRADLQSLVARAGDAVSPLLDKLYQKALHSHDAVFDPTVSKYDLGFRLQSALRLLRYSVIVM